MSQAGWNILSTWFIINKPNRDYPKDPTTARHLTTTPTHTVLYYINNSLEFNIYTF